MAQNSQIETIRERVDIVDVIREYVPSLKKAGRTYKARCPFHNEKTPSFTVNQDKGMFYCFGCQSGGDVFAFVMKIENIPFNEAAEKLAKRAGIEWQQDSRTLGPEQKERLEIKKTLDFAAGFFHKTLLETAAAGPARDYLAKRGLTRETTGKFMLGYAPGTATALANAAKKAGYSAQQLHKAGLVSAAETGSRDYFRDRVIFPITDQRGDTVAFGGRVMGDGQPKYLNSPETAVFVKSRVLYGLNLAAQPIRRTGRAVLLEGYMDVIACHQHGADYTVAPLGTSLGEGHAALLKRYASEAVVLFDGDSAGIRAALRAGRILTAAGIYTKISLLPDGQDPDDYVRAHGKDGLEKLLARAVDVAAFHTQLALAEVKKPLSPVDKTRLADLLAETVAMQPDEIVRAEWLRDTAEKIGVSENLFAKRVREVKGGASAPEREGKTAAPEELPNPPAEERDLVRHLLRHPELIRLADERTEEEFSSRSAWAALAELRILLDDGVAQAALVTELAARRPELGKWLFSLAVEEFPASATPAREIAACAEMIKRAHLSRRYREITGRLLQLQKTGEQPPAELLREQFKLGVLLKSSRTTKE
ncbi:MAG: DNA primase [Elusimicrobiaceae bacterium]|nr:DNA primase [Elusimicrobiaceae bacterium]